MQCNYIIIPYYSYLQRIQLSRQVETELKANVIQAEETKPGIYRKKKNIGEESIHITRND